MWHQFLCSVLNAHLMAAGARCHAAQSLTLWACGVQESLGPDELSQLDVQSYAAGFVPSPLRSAGRARQG
jgi:hypothetical protein